MDWTPGGMSEDVEDRRGDADGGGGGGFNIGGGGLGIGGVVVLLVISLFTGRNYLGRFLSGGGAVQQSRPAPARDGRGGSEPPAEDRSAPLVSFGLAGGQKTWPPILADRGVHYRQADIR